jgi:hypothetical protein
MEVVQFTACYSLCTWQEGEEDCILRSFITCMLHKMLLGWSNQGG